MKLIRSVSLSAFLFLVFSTCSFAQTETKEVVETAQLIITQGKSKVRYDYKNFDDLLKFTPELIQNALDEDKHKNSNKKCNIKVSFSLTCKKGSSSESLNSNVTTECESLINDVTSLQKDLINLLRKEN
ncbi:hypothetical protein [Flavobacterium sp.]|uniref:hypothetical protein n=1 Tax=Flavobacterium sp. TaxID=239 RepID=UPI003B9DBC34